MRKDESMADTTLRTPREWEPITGLKILDADGWRGTDARPFDDEISESEFRYRASTSTIRSSRPVWTETPEEEFERVALSGSDEGDEVDE